MRTVMNAIPEQLDLFEENGDVALLQRELASLRKQCAQWQRTMTSKYRQLSKLCLHLQEENGLLQQKLHAMEKNLPSENSGEANVDDDYLMKLFAAAYFSPP